MEHPRLLTLLDMLTLLHCNVASRNLVHANTDESHQANSRVVCLDEDDCSSSQGSDVALASADTALIDLLCVWIAETLEQRLREERAIDDVSLLDGTTNGRVPSVVAQRGQEGLVDSGAGKLLCKLVMRKHVKNGVWLALDPELVAELGVLDDVVGL